MRGGGRCTRRAREPAAQNTAIEIVCLPGEFCCTHLEILRRVDRALDQLQQLVGRGVAQKFGDVENSLWSSQ